MRWSDQFFIPKIFGELLRGTDINFQGKFLIFFLVLMDTSDIKWGL